VQVVSFDFVDETMAYVQKGVIYGTIGQDPFAQGHDPAIRLFNMLVGGVSPECGRMVTKADVVTKENIDKFWSGAAAAPAEPAEAAIPAFDSACTPGDEGTVTPVDIQPDKPLKIAVLGLENNPFWIPVKEGTMKAAEELKAYNVTVDWIVPGEQHTGDVFGPGIEAAIAHNTMRLRRRWGSRCSSVHRQGRGSRHPGGDLQLGNRDRERTRLLCGGRPV
jgi:ABC-type sugar transport system substrate-binding protein